MRNGLIGGGTDLTRTAGVLSMADASAYAANRNGRAAMSAYAYDTNNTTGISGTVRSVVYGNNGLRAYVCILGGTRTTAAIHQLNLSTPYDLASKTNPSKSLIVGDYVLNCTTCTFNAAGTKLYVGGYNATSGSDERCFECDLTTAWEIDTAKPQVKKLYIGGEETVPYGLTFKPDGTKLYVIGTTGDDVNQYDLSTAWDISTASFVSSASVATQATTPTSVKFNDTGTKCFVLNSGNDTIYQYSVSPAWTASATSFTYDNVSYSVTTQEATPIGFTFGNSGSDLYISGTTGDNIVRYALSTAYSLASVTFTSESTGTGDSAPRGLFFRDNGTRVYVAGNNAGTIRAYNLTGSAWDTGSTNLSLQNTTGPFMSLAGMSDVAIGDSGTKVFWLDDTRLCVYQATLGTAWDVSTIEGVLLASSRLRYDSLVIGNSDTNLYLADATATLYRYTLSTAGRLHTAGAEQTQAMGVGTIQGIALSGDGDKLYVVGANNYSIFRFTLPTAFSLASATLDGYISAGGDVGTYAQTVPDFGSVNVNLDATQVEAWCTATGTIAQHRWRLRF